MSEDLKTVQELADRYTEMALKPDVIKAIKEKTPGIVNDTLLTGFGSLLEAKKELGRVKPYTDAEYLAAVSKICADGGLPFDVELEDPK